MKTPSRARTSGVSSRRFLPSKSTSPCVTSYCGWPARTFASVDLPEPFGPMMACTSPLLTLRLMPFRISLPSTDAYRLRISNTCSPCYRSSLRDPLCDLCGECLVRKSPPQRHGDRTETHGEFPKPNLLAAFSRQLGTIKADG